MLLPCTYRSLLCTYRSPRGRSYWTITSVSHTHFIRFVFAFKVLIVQFTPPIIASFRCLGYCIFVNFSSFLRLAGPPHTYPYVLSPIQDTPLSFPHPAVLYQPLRVLLPLVCAYDYGSRLVPSLSPMTYHTTGTLSLDSHLFVTESSPPRDHLYVL